ncbi:MAG TPA: LuxR C-terminal-related transcriptional regulator [Bryobacteraceae bacterium]|nr:LuxR C-terminal-related transcriptional regulator [Bryobacteraceae bacterium]
MRSDYPELRALVVAVRGDALLSQVQQGVRRQAANGEFSVLITKPDETLPHVCARLRPCILIVEAEVICSAPWAPELRKLSIAGATILAIAADRLDTTVLRLLHHGCSGLVEQRSVVQQLARAVSCLLKGEYWVNRRLLSVYCRSLRAELLFGVSKREREIWELIATGASNNAIAEHLCVSPQTVHWHIRGLYRKIGATSRGQAILLWFGFDAALASVGSAARKPSAKLSLVGASVEP